MTTVGGTIRGESGRIYVGEQRVFWGYVLHFKRDVVGETGDDDDAAAAGVHSTLLYLWSVTMLIIEEGSRESFSEET